MGRLLLAGILVLCPALAMSAIYKCVDKQGNTSFSSKPCPAKKISGNSDAHMLWKDLKVMSDRGKEIVRSVGADLDSIKVCNTRSKRYKTDVQQLKPRIDQLSQKHIEMIKAFEILPECGVCKARGAARCSLVDRHLDSAKNELVEIPVKQPPPWARRRPQKTGE